MLDVPDSPRAKNLIVSVNVTLLEGETAAVGLRTKAGTSDVTAAMTSADEWLIMQFPSRTKESKPRPAGQPFDELALAMVDGRAALYGNGKLVSRLDGFDKSLDRHVQIKVQTRKTGNVRAQFRNVRAMVLAD